ncbi:UNVERIFIED_CONTAM: hypothetical protein Scaly_3074700 [Sesamum calycinum]|uniref:Uncharacterized protein n=1 Tax=Sesamum calycinum TaxID=2727403 RepID=A0AAW2JX11_9LAMI
MSDAKPRTSLRSYWHTLQKKKDPIEDESEVQQISTALLTEPYVNVNAHTAPSQQAVSLPLQGMEVWMNRIWGYSSFLSIEPLSLIPLVQPSSRTSTIDATKIANSIIKEIRKRATIWHQISGGVERAAVRSGKTIKKRRLFVEVSKDPLVLANGSQLQEVGPIAQAETFSNSNSSIAIGQVGALPQVSTSIGKRVLPEYSDPSDIDSVVQLNDPNLNLALNGATVSSPYAHSSREAVTIAGARADIQPWKIRNLRIVSSLTQEAPQGLPEAENLTLTDTFFLRKSFHSERRRGRIKAFSLSKLSAKGIERFVRIDSINRNFSMDGRKKVSARVKCHIKGRLKARLDVIEFTTYHYEYSYAPAAEQLIATPEIKELHFFPDSRQRKKKGSQPLPVSCARIAVQRPFITTLSIKGFTALATTDDVDKGQTDSVRVSKARLIYPFSKADVTDSSGFILIGYQKDKNYALTGRHLCLSSPIRRPLAEREIEDQERYKSEVSTPLQEDWLLSTSSFSSSDSSYTLLSSQIPRCGPGNAPESKKKFGTNAVNGGGSGCSGDSFLVALEVPKERRKDRTLLEGRSKKEASRPKTIRSSRLTERAGLVAGAGGFFSFDGLEGLSVGLLKNYAYKAVSCLPFLQRRGTACIRPDSRAARSFVSALPLGLEAHLTIFVLSDCFCFGCLCPLMNHQSNQPESDRRITRMMSRDNFFFKHLLQDWILTSFWTIFKRKAISRVDHAGKDRLTNERELPRLNKHAPLMLRLAPSLGNPSMVARRKCSGLSHFFSLIHRFSGSVFLSPPEKRERDDRDSEDDASTGSFRSDPALPKEQSAVTSVGSTSDLKECSGVPASLSHYSMVCLY